MILKLDEVAEQLRVSQRTVLRLIRKGELVGIKVGGQWRVRDFDLDAYVIEGVESAHGGASKESSPEQVAGPTPNL